MFVESNQRLLQASQQSATALRNEQKAFDKLWQRYQSWLNRTEADLEQARGIPLFAGTLGVPKLQKLSVVAGRVQLTGIEGNNPVQRSSSQPRAVASKNQTQSAPTQISDRSKTPTTVRQSPQSILAQPDELKEAEQLYRQAIQLHNQGRHREAIPLAKRSLAIREKALSANDTNVIQSLNLLANLYESQGNYAEAYSLYRRSSNIIEKTLEGIPPDVATRLNNLAESRIRDSVPGKTI
jgi:tetratricopeptide (TPR) repeat protein